MILLYHLVFPDNTPKDAWNAGLVLRLSAFKRQITWLKKRFEILSLEDYMAAFVEDARGVKGKAAITFDDGYRAVYDLVSPFLIKEEIPAAFFLTTSHLEDRELLWFVTINALCSEKCYERIEVDGQRYSLTTRNSSMAAWRKLIDLARESHKPIEFARELAQKYPLPSHVIAKYEGMSAKQIADIGQSDLFEVGSHTHQHYYLDQILPSEQRQEMLINKRKLEALLGHPVKYFAYTGGIYTAETIKAVKRSGFEAAFAITPRHLGSERKFEVPRVDIYSPSLIKFKAKIFGLQNYLRYLMHRGK